MEIIFEPAHHNTAQQHIPDYTGVYFFLDSKKNPLYIGKAVNIKRRIQQHLRDKKNPKERVIINKTRFLRFQETRSEFEALIAEAHLVKQYQPPYNSELKDDKTALYIIVVRGEFGIVHIVRKKQLTTQERFSFGPLKSTYEARFLLRRIRKITPFCMERRVTKTPCFYEHLGLCQPCPGRIAQLKEPERLQEKKRYQKNIRRVISILRGGGRRVLRELRKEMEVLSQKERFEEAALLRDRLLSFESLFRGGFDIDQYSKDPEFARYIQSRENEALKSVLRLPKLERAECYDVSTMGFTHSTASMVVFQNAAPVKSAYRRFKIKRSRTFDPDMLVEALSRRFTHEEWSRPDLIVVDGGAPQIRRVQQALKKIFNNKAPQLIGIAKRPDRVVIGRTGGVLPLPPDSPALHYIQRMRDEAHRFAKQYHLLLRRKNFLL